MMQTRRVGDTDVSAIGLGAMELSLRNHPDPAQGMRTVHAALDAGVRLIDTADAYCIGEHDVGANERLVAEALANWPGDSDEVLVATKGGHTRPEGRWEVDGRPNYLRHACEQSLVNLGVDAIGLYQFHRPDPRVPYAESVGALAELQQEGKIRQVGVSNANVDQIREAMSIVRLASVQNEFSPSFRRSMPELALCVTEQVTFLAYSPLGGMGDAKRLGEEHPVFARVAKERGVSPQQVALAWELAQAPCVIPIPGASRPETILDSARAADLELTDEELSLLDAASTGVG